MLDFIKTHFLFGVKNEVLYSIEESYLILCTKKGNELKNFFMRDLAKLCIVNHT